MRVINEIFVTNTRQLGDCAESLRQLGDPYETERGGLGQQPTNLFLVDDPAQETPDHPRRFFHYLNGKPKVRSNDLRGSGKTSLIVVDYSCLSEVTHESVNRLLICYNG